MPAMIASNRFHVPDQELHQDHQEEQPEQPQFNSFKGLYIGSALIDHLNLVDPNQEYWFYVADYINSFPYSRSFFEIVFPFYMGSHIIESELIAFYQNNFCECVEFFKLNHPDWSEYSNSECLQHFKDAIEDYTYDSGDYSDVIYRMYQTTPPTLEKPHFSVYQERYLESTNEYQERFIGVGYFANVDGQTIPYRNQMGANGPFGYSQRFNLQMHLDQLVANETMNSLDDVHDVADLNFYYENNNVEFAFAFHTDPETLVQTRFLCNSEELFLFEESFQRVKEEKRIEKIRKDEMRRKFEEEKRLEKIRKDEEMKRKFEDEKRKREIEQMQQTQYRTTSNEDWVRRTSHAFRPDDPSVIEIQAMFAAASQSILPFQNLNLPVPRVNPTDYRDPLPHYNEEDEFSDSYYHSHFFRSGMSI
jgi:hypothetical protein